jgi:hypothetical protein
MYLVIHSGQACIASNRILVHESVYDQFAELLAEQVSKLKCGPGFEKSSTIGPLINQKAVDKVRKETSVVNLLVLFCRIKYYGIFFYFTIMEIYAARYVILCFSLYPISHSSICFL